jgi:hypothetical protein
MGTLGAEMDKLATPKIYFTNRALRASARQRAQSGLVALQFGLAWRQHLRRQENKQARNIFFQFPICFGIKQKKPNTYSTNCFHEQTQNNSTTESFISIRILPHTHTLSHGLPCRLQSRVLAQNLILSGAEHIATRLSLYTKIPT